jgi:hypothetical protein
MAAAIAAIFASPDPISAYGHRAKVITMMAVNWKSGGASRSLSVRSASGASASIAPRPANLPTERAVDYLVEDVDMSRGPR